VCRNNTWVNARMMNKLRAKNWGEKKVTIGMTYVENQLLK